MSLKNSSSRAGRRWPRWLQIGLWLVALICLGWVTFVWLESYLYQSYASWQLERQRQHSSVSEAIEPGSPGDQPLTEGLKDQDHTPEIVLNGSGRLQIPRLNLSVMVEDGIGSTVLRRAAGRIPGTALPGQAGNVGIAAHRDTYFRPLKDIQTGDTVLFTTPTRTFFYRVEWSKVVEPEEISVLDATEKPSLTLVTCYPFYWVGSAPQRFVVRASQVNDTDPRP